MLESLCLKHDSEEIQWTRSINSITSISFLFFYSVVSIFKISMVNVHSRTSQYPKATRTKWRRSMWTWSIGFWITAVYLQCIFDQTLYQIEFVSFHFITHTKKTRRINLKLGKKYNPLWTDHVIQPIGERNGRSISVVSITFRSVQLEGKKLATIASYR